MDIKPDFKCKDFGPQRTDSFLQYSTNVCQTKQSLSQWNEKLVHVQSLSHDAKKEAEITRLQKASCDRLDITLDAVNQEIAKLAFVDAGQFLTIDSEGKARLDLMKISNDPDPGTGERHVRRCLQARQRHALELATIKSARYDLDRALQDGGITQTGCHG